MTRRRILRVFPEPPATLPLEEVYVELDLPPSEAGRPYTLINAVGTLDGRGAIAGKSTPIGSEIDHRLMRNIRANVDAVLVGAGTLRSEDLTLTVDEPLTTHRTQRGLEKQPLPIILTASGRIPSDRKIFRDDGDGVIIFAGPDADRQNLTRLSRQASVYRAAEGSALEPESILQTLAGEFGVRRLLVEGGPSVNRSFLQPRLVDELFLTLAPKIAGGAQRSLVEGDPLPPETAAESLTLLSAYLSDSELFLRYRFPNSALDFR